MIDKIKDINFRVCIDELNVFDEVPGQAFIGLGKVEDYI